MLASVGVDSSSLPTASQSKVFDGYDRMLSTAETQMPLPEVGLPSKSANDTFHQKGRLSINIWQG